jgi:hypothetical protein
VCVVLLVLTGCSSVFVVEDASTPPKADSSLPPLDASIADASEASPPPVSTDADATAECSLADLLNGDGSFENGLGLYTAQGVLTTTSDVHRGVRAARVCGPPGPPVFLQRRISNIPPGAYHIQLWTKRAPTGGSFTAQIYATNFVLGPPLPSGSTYGCQDIEFSVPLDAGTGFLDFQAFTAPDTLDAGAQTCVYVDDFVLHALLPGQRPPASCACPVQ